MLTTSPSVLLNINRIPGVDGFETARADSQDSPVTPNHYSAFTDKSCGSEGYAHGGIDSLARRTALLRAKVKVLVPTLARPKVELTEEHSGPCPRRLSRGCGRVQPAADFSGAGWHHDAEIVDRSVERPRLVTVPEHCDQVCWRSSTPPIAGFNVSTRAKRRYRCK